MERWRLAGSPHVRQERSRPCYSPLPRCARSRLPDGRYQTRPPRRRRLGSVYLAEQHEPIERIVAFKLMRSTLAAAAPNAPRLRVGHAATRNVVAREGRLAKAETLDREGPSSLRNFVEPGDYRIEEAEQQLAEW